MQSDHPPPDSPPTSADGWLRWLPGLQMLRQYRLAWLPNDIAAGLVLTTMLVPVGIAYAGETG
jgi:MFS superfamily sulfate permease-like transporter